MVLWVSSLLPSGPGRGGGMVDGKVRTRLPSYKMVVTKNGKNEILLSLQVQLLVYLIDTS